MSKKIAVKASLDLNQTIGYLEEVINCLREGTLCVQKADDFVTLKPQNDIMLTIEAAQKKDKESLEIEMRWRTETNPAPISEVFISDTEPEIEAEAVLEVDEDDMDDNWENN